MLNSIQWSLYFGYLTITNFHKIMRHQNCPVKTINLVQHQLCGIYSLQCGGFESPLIKRSGEVKKRGEMPTLQGGRATMFLRGRRNELRIEFCLARLSVRKPTASNRKSISKRKRKRISNATLSHHDCRAI